MGCVSSKCIREEIKLEEQQHHVTLTNNGGGGYLNHVVSLTSTTYGALKLDNEQQHPTPKKTQCVVTTASSDSKTHRESPSPSPARKEEKPEAIINTWELMEGLEEETQLQLQPLTVKKSPKSTPFLRGFTATTPSDTTKRSPSLKLVKRSIGKENKVLQDNNGFTRGGGVRRLDYPSPKSNNVLKTAHSCPNTCKPAFNSGFQPKGSPIHAKRNSVGSETGSAKSLQRKSPLFDPDLVASYERELSEEEEQIKRMIWATPRTRRARKSIDSMKLLQSFEKKCPPGGENVIVIYTTTLRGIRKTFEDCNKVRSIVESYYVHVVERDVSMDSGFKEELRKLMGTKEVKVPVVFVKGRLVGGAEQVVKLEEEEKLGALFEGIPMAVGGGGCEGCGGVRFLMCVACNGSCKVLDSEDPKKTVRCGKCNENGIVQCPLCC